MSDCSDKNIGQLLHDYELGLLPEEDNYRFEMHLYECDYCLERAREFMDVSKILAQDPDAHAIIKEAAGKTDKKTFSPYLKYLIAAILVVVIIAPIYKYGIYEEPSEVTQTLDFLPTRVGGSDVIYLEKGGDVAISFYVAEGFNGPADLIISKVDGDTVLQFQNFDDFNERGLGSITVPVADFSEGHYSLHIHPTTDVDLEHEKRYMFRVK